VKFSLKKYNSTFFQSDEPASRLILSDVLFLCLCLGKNPTIFSQGVNLCKSTVTNVSHVKIHQAKERLDLLSNLLLSTSEVPYQNADDNYMRVVSCQDSDIP